MADTARAAGRTKKLLVGGLVTLAGVAIALALIFTVGGQGPHKDKSLSPAPATTSSLADTQPAEVTEPVKAATPATTPATTPAKTPATTTPATTPAKTPATTPAKTPATTTTTPASTGTLADVFSGTDLGKLGDPLQAAAALTTSKDAMDGYLGESGTCWVSSADELVTAVADPACPTVMLGNGDAGAYALSDELVITRPVTIIGHPRLMPIIDGSGTTRAIHVMNGGYLDLRFVRVKQGAGTTYNRIIFGGGEARRKLQDAPNSNVAVIYGGSILFDVGALGGNIRAVIFLAVANTPASVINAVTSTINFVGGRLIGGHVAMIAGIVNFIGCVFWDTSLLLPFTDQITIGGDVLVMGGAVNFIGCFWFATMLIGNFGGAGFNVGVFGGSAVFTACVVTSQGAMQGTNGAGQLFLVGGGVMVIAGMDFRLVTGGLFFTGIGDWFVGGGVMILTGFTIENAYGLLVALGAGFYTATGGGVLVQAGVTFFQTNGPNFQALAGASIFLGGGSAHHTGVPSSFYGSVGFFAGPGAYAYDGPGYAHWVGVPLAVFAAVYAFYGVGIAWAHMNGFLVFVGNPSYAPVAVTYAAGDGSTLWAGPGAGIIGASPTYQPAAVAYFNSDNLFNFFIINGNTATGSADPPINFYATYNESADPVDPEDVLAKLEAHKQPQTKTWTVFGLSTILTDSSNIPEFYPQAMAAGFTALEETHRLVRARRNIRELSLRDLAARANGALLAVGNAPGGATLVLACNNSEPAVSQGEGGAVIVEGPTCADIQPELEKVSAYQATLDDGVHFQPTVVIPVTVTLDSGEKINAADVRDAFSSALGGLKGLEAVPAVATTSAAVTEEFTRRHVLRHLSASVVDGLLTGGSTDAAASTGFQTFDLNLVTRFLGDSDLLQSQLTSDATDNVLAPIKEAVKDYLNSKVGGAGVKDISLEYGGKAISIPAYDTAAFKDFVNRAAGDSSLNADVDLKDKDGAALKTAQVGDEVVATVINFPKDTKAISIQLIGSDAGPAGLKQTVANVATNVPLDADGSVTHSFTIPTGTKLGDYYVIAFDAKNKANIAMGDVFAVTNVPKARRKLGPRMYF